MSMITTPQVIKWATTGLFGGYSVWAAESEVKSLSCSVGEREVDHAEALIPVCVRDEGAGSWYVL